MDDGILILWSATRRGGDQKGKAGVEHTMAGFPGDDPGPSDPQKEFPGGGSMNGKSGKRPSLTDDLQVTVERAKKLGPYVTFFFLSSADDHKCKSV